MELNAWKKSTNEAEVELSDEEDAVDPTKDGVGGAASAVVVFFLSGSLTPLDVEWANIKGANEENIRRIFFNDYVLKCIPLEVTGHV